MGISEEQMAAELYMTPEELHEIKDKGDMFLGVHAYSHEWLGSMPDAEAVKDVKKSLEVLDEFIDCSSWVMNYPYGNPNNAVINYIKELGCKLGITTEPRVAQIGEDDRFLLPRLDCNDLPPISNNYI